MKIRAVALDDEEPALEIIEAFCSQLDFIDLRKTFTRSGEAKLYLEENPIDLIFLDVNMPAISGLDFFKNIPQQMMVIFTTAFGEYAVEGFELNAVDYILKPFTYKRFEQAAQKAQELHHFYLKNNPEKEQYFYFRVDYSLVKVLATDILFIEGLDNYLKIHLQNQKPLVVRITMKAMMEKLPNEDFVRVHRSFIVPIKRIKSVRNKVILIENEEIPIGSSYEEEFNKTFGI
jgi:DNA-binding LytR/AlgR family response regulator